ncbi:hypothetical protein JoomaDRAFT_1123 [Galbibacter orientalis DSM 19592]|uniref:DUF4421 domain-containing protein n=1 Tax=Galbibacter orientalis DSM 19592 TaxID=926559 RepID=I3C3E9_9FLAO|nr:DUF4421 family protein [Galbibacter orientalis]EIJ38142.1 hypothetical protein JoomaDRAFT_1123 [Galbibacter orientalis DSM 19592]
MKLKDFLFFIIFLSFILSLKAQESNLDSISVEVENITKYPDKITLRVGLTNEANSYEITTPSEDFSVTIAPNQRLRSNISLLFRFIEINIGYTPAFLKFNDDNDEKGKTTFFNIGTRFYYKKWMQNLEWNKTKGFYVDLNDIAPGEPNIIFPDFEVLRIGGNTSYIFNDNFSFRTIFKQNEWQKRSAGSFVPTLSYYYSRISNDSSDKDKFIDITIGPSYFYNWVINKRFIVTSGAHLGVGYSHITSKSNNVTTSMDGLNYQGQVTLGLGYNIPNFFTGVSLNSQSFNHNTDGNNKLSDQHAYVEFHIGYRFDAPKKVLEKMNQLQQKVGL